MILGFGIDAVNILRFNYYADCIPNFLPKIFSYREQLLNRTQLAGNFAAREAFLKACPPSLTDKITKVEFLRNSNGAPTIELSDLSGKPFSFFEVHVSLSNMDNLAIAAIILEETLKSDD